MSMVKTRFAPSPTGYLHIGGLRTALYNYLFAKKHGGIFALRIEDTDRNRYVPGAVESLLHVLEAMGLQHDEGPILTKEGLIEQKGSLGPYIQSERLSLYTKYAHELLERGLAYECFCSSERLESVRSQQGIAKLPTKYDRHCVTLSPEERTIKHTAGEPCVIRLKIPDGETTFDDLIRGRITIHNQEIDDQVLIKSDGFPTYHLANVIDDHLMEVTHVIRAEEWISSTPKHVLLYQAFEWDIPQFAHLPLILNPDRSKLSKRQGDVAVEDYLRKGYLPEALINFVALLGFNPKADQELYRLEELAELFDIEKVNKSGAVFMTDKLDWMNGQYIRTKTPEEITKLSQPFLKKAEIKAPEEILIKICTVEKERLVLLSDLVEKTRGYLILPTYQANLLVWKKSTKEDARLQLQNIIPVLEGFNNEITGSSALIETALREYIEEKHLQNGNVLWPLRVALSGLSASPAPFELLWVLGKEESLRRIHKAITMLEE